MRLRSSQLVRYLSCLAATLLALAAIFTWGTAKADIVTIWAAIQANEDDLVFPEWSVDWGKIAPTIAVDDFITQQEGELVQLSYALARLARAAYADTTSDTNDSLVLADMGMKKLAFVNPKRTALVTPEALVALAPGFGYGSQALVVAIRGSDTFSDWLLDFAALNVSDTDATYHKGFHDYADALKSGVDKAIGPYCNDGRTRIWFTGHSLGGAAAQLLAYWTAKRGCKVHGVMTFGAPTPGRADFRNDYVKLQGGALNKNTHRWLHELDPVPCLPASSVWKDVGVRHMVWGGDFGAAGSEPYGLYVTGSTPGMPPRPPVCLDESGAIVAKLDRIVDEGVDIVVNTDCPEGLAARVFWGILSRGQSELVCTGAPLAVALADASEQVISNLFDGTDGQLAIGSHKMRPGYLLPLRAAARGDIRPTGITLGPTRQPDGCYPGERCEERFPNGKCLCVDDDLHRF